MSTEPLTREPITRLVTGRLVAANDDVARLELSDGRSAWMPRGEFYAMRTWKEGYWYLLGQLGTGNDPQVSATRADLIPLLLSSYCPEIRDGRVRIMTVAREAGVRTKVAVAATVPGLDPVAACLGRGANRIQAASRQLGGERIDIVAWNADPAVFIRNALGPVAITDIHPGEDGSWNIIVEPHAASASVGGGGMNVRLAGALIGARLSIRTSDDPTTPVRLQAGNTADTLTGPAEA